MVVVVVVVVGAAAAMAEDATACEIALSTCSKATGMKEIALWSEMLAAMKDTEKSATATACATEMPGMR